MGRRLPTVFIRISQGGAPKDLHLRDMYSYSLVPLSRMGMLDLEHYELLDHVIGEAVGKYARRLGEFGLQVRYDQIHLDELTIAIDSSRWNRNIRQSMAIHSSRWG